MKTRKQSQKTWSVITLTAFALLFITQTTSAQTVYSLNGDKTTSVQVVGSSNVHDWTMIAKEVESTGSFKFNTKDELIDLTSLKFTVIAKSLKSEKSSMDARTYKSIKADQFPKISYQLTSASVTAVQGNKYTILTNGNLTIAGKTQAISMKVSAVINADKSISCHGSQKLMLTDYGIEPPSFMLGAMKVGNDLTIKFDLNYTKTSTAK